MEVELKYTIPDYETFEQLLSLTHLAAYWLRPAGDKRLIDHYYDTLQRAAFHKRRSWPAARAEEKSWAVSQYPAQ